MYGVDSRAERHFEAWAGRKSNLRRGSKGWEKVGVRRCGAGIDFLFGGGAYEQGTEYNIHAQYVYPESEVVESK